MKRLALLLLKGYQRFISPLLPPACRFYPTCSVYAVGCFERYGFFRACWLTVVRLSKCHPFHPGGLDPVPEPQQEAEST
jgi:putative membrane protein insertion efficiency factor